MTQPASNPANAMASLIDPKTLMSIRNLELRARAVVEGFWNGIHRSPYHGFSVEFTEYRQYATGDDIRHVDWRVYGRTDRYYIRKFEDETNLRCQFVVDQSRSMTYGSAGYTKAEYAATLAATLGWFLYQQGDAVGLLRFDETIRDFLPARHRLGHLRLLMGALQMPAEGQGTDISAPLDHVAALLRRRGMVVLLSDMLAPLDRLEPSLARIIAGRQEVVIFQILDPAERTFPFSAPSVFEDVETGRTLFVDPSLVRKKYLAKFEAHQAALKAMCDKLGATLHCLGTDQPLELALFDFLQQRRARGKRAPQVRGGASRGA